MNYEIDVHFQISRIETGSGNYRMFLCGIEVPPDTAIEFIALFYNGDNVTCPHCRRIIKPFKSAVDKQVEQFIETMKKEVMPVPMGDFKVGDAVECDGGEIHVIGTVADKDIEDRCWIVEGAPSGEQFKFVADEMRKISQERLFSIKQGGIFI